ncbi:hypothetical protein WT33_23100 [Burkholderia stagnalis]|nr:hypothetical protein WT33_23100 [Burkholderia stagnalis]
MPRLPVFPLTIFTSYAGESLDFSLKLHRQLNNLLADVDIKWIIQNFIEINHYARELSFLVIGFPHLVPPPPLDQAVVTIYEKPLSFVPFTVEANQLQGTTTGISTVVGMVRRNFFFRRKKICLYKNLTVFAFGRYAYCFRVVCSRQRMTHWIIGFHRDFVDGYCHPLPTGCLTFEKTMKYQSEMSLQGPDF